MDADVVVVGAGLAGLRCAVALREAGREVVVLEAADAVGGRIRTDVVDGFRVDRGFQLLNPAYPAVGRWVDVDALGLQSFGAGVVARTDTGAAVLGHPLREPGLLASTLGVAGRRPREVAALLRWLAPLLVPRRHRTLSQVLDGAADRPLGEALDHAHLGGLLRTVLDRFFAGVVLEDDQTTSAHYALLLTWMFARGVPGLPRDGMQALPAQLAAGLGERVRLSTPVEAVVPDAGGGAVAVRTADGTLRATSVVLAVGPDAVAGLSDLPAPPTNGVVTTWWSVPRAPTTSDLLHVDGRAHAGGPVVNCAVVSNAAPSYAPAGRHLVQASALMGGARATPAEVDVRRHAAALLGGPAADPNGADWEVVARHEVPHALPAQPAPYSSRRPVDLGSGLLVCGDHRDTASIQGALVSGDRAARAVLAGRPGPAARTGRR